MRPERYYSIIVGPLVVLFGLMGFGIAGWLAFNDPLALAIVVVFFLACYKTVRWLMNPWSR